MILLAVICSLSVLVLSVVMFGRDLRNELHGRIDAAATSIENEILLIEERVIDAAGAIASNSDLTDAVIHGNQEKLILTAYNLRTIAQLDFLTVVDSNALVLLRTHQLAGYGDDLSDLANISIALRGETGVFVIPGATIKLGILAGTPIYNEINEIVGAVSLGYRFDTQRFVNELKGLAGCEVSFYLYNECISTTLVDERGLPSVGIVAPGSVTDVVFAGKSFTGNAALPGGDAYQKYVPIFGADGTVVGMLAVSEYTSGNADKIKSFAVNGSIIMPAAILLCFFIAHIISGAIEARFKQMMNTIREEDERIKAMLDAMPLAANFFDTHHNNIHTNEESVRMFGLERKQDYLDRIHELSPEFQPDGSRSYDKTYEYVKEAFEKGQVKFEWMHQNLKGEQIPCEVTLVRIKFKDEFVVVGYCRDLREVRAAISEKEKAIHEKNALEFVEMILNAIDVMIYVTDPATGEILFMNDTTKKHYALEGETVGKVCFKVFQNGYTERCSFCPCNELDLNPDKIVVWEELSTATDRIYKNIDRYIKWTNGKNVHMQNKIDITELVTAKENAEQSNRSKGFFLAQMSHEIRTPMNAILGISEIQLRDKNFETEAEFGFIKIYETGNLLLNIINDILDFSKIEAGRLEIVPFVYDIPSLINDSVQINRLRYESKPLDFKLHVDENTPLELIGDEVRVRQILNNLLSNAYKYTEAGEVGMIVSSEAIDEDNVMLVIEVNDTGQGMKEDQVQRLFDEYSRFNMETNRSISGTGLGMNITKRLIDMMNGEISVQSEAGVGSVFTVRLPQKIAGAAICGSEVADKLKNFDFYNTGISKKAQIAHEYMPYGKILVVDDVESNIYVAKGLLIPYGLNVETAGNGIEAIEMIKENGDYDIVFMDHMMPKMDGLKATKHIRAMGYTRPIVALTANAVVGQSEMFLTNGFDGFLSKPIDSRELDALIIDIIRDKKPAKVMEAARREHGSDKHVEQTADMKMFFSLDAENTIKVLSSFTALREPGEEDFESFVTAAHGIKSALANIGE
ncbi:MAG: ATP-binding protein, partial [Defluviitaleaceae bacterium]|nr:ATP-binding protein [Defluviitaleaceae bacterium]